MTKRQDLKALAGEILERNVTPVLRENATQLVMGDGNPDADIVFIGEAPGKSEDEQGVPFVGASGKFLDEMLVVAGLKRKDVYITNIVKYRPPNNRDPSSEEKREFWPYLIRQLEIIKPKIVVTLGRHSGMAFFPELVISKDHGRAQTFKYQGGEFLVMPLYHPATALYNGSMRQVLIDDFLATKELSDTGLLSAD